MKLRDKTLLITTVFAAVTITFVLLERQKKKKKEAHMRDTIADEGYETAGDILYPLKTKKRHKSKMNFGYGH